MDTSTEEKTGIDLLIPYIPTFMYLSLHIFLLPVATMWLIDCMDDEGIYFFPLIGLSCVCVK